VALTALVWLDAAGEVTSLTCSGPLTGTTARRAARGQVTTEHAADRVLRETRAAAADEEALRPHAERLRKVPGLAGVTLTNARLVADALEWDVEATNVDGAHYVARIDAIGGHVLGLARVGGVR